MAKTLSTDNYLQITQLMQASVAERRREYHIFCATGILSITLTAFNDTDRFLKEIKFAFFFFF